MGALSIIDHASRRAVAVAIVESRALLNYFQQINAENKTESVICMNWMSGLKHLAPPLLRGQRSDAVIGAELLDGSNSSAVNLRTKHKQRQTTGLNDMKRLIWKYLLLGALCLAPLSVYSQDGDASAAEEAAAEAAEMADEGAEGDEAGAGDGGDEAAATLDSGDTAWMIVATALVLFMTLPGLALFYGGLVRSKNVLSVLVQCFAICGVMSLLWVIFGYALAVGGEGKFIGGDWNMLGLNHLTLESLTGSIPESVYATFQMTFAIITPALIVGAFAERMKFKAILLFTISWFIFSYLPIWHMAWNPNGLFWGWGVIDFAGGNVVHINAGIAGLAACILVGKRKGFPKTLMMPHNVPLVVIGASMLWVGWFGFNAGSELAADGVAGMAMLATQIATATAVVTWMIVEWCSTGKPTAVGVATGAVAGLVAITPASGVCGPLGAIIIGFSAAVICYFGATTLKKKFGYDDSLDVFGVHGIGGIVGAILSGVVAYKAFGGSGYHEASSDTAMLAQVFIQMKSVIVTIIWSGVVSVVALIAIDKTVGLRVDEDVEEQGLDFNEFGETGYNH
jgi:ammonium transporter, Amt family